MEVLLEEIDKIYELEIKKNTKQKKKIYYFEKYKMQNMMKIIECLRTNNYKTMKYNIFMIKHPKYRIVMSLNISDKLINHFVTRNILIKKLEYRLSYRNVATRKNMGRDYGLDLVKKDIEVMKKHGNFYILKIDISKYFYSVDHSVLKKMIKPYLDDEEFKIISNIISSTNEGYINTTINKLKANALKNSSNRHDEINLIPNYKTGKGLPIGNMSSQFLSIYYLSEIDHIIIHDYKIKNYTRYMDDMILMSNDLKKLKDVRHKLETLLYEKYFLLLNNKKTKISNSNEGFVFCGYRFRVINNKTIITICSSTRNRIKKRVKELSYLHRVNKMEIHSLFSSITTYQNSFKYSFKKINRIIENNFFSKLN